MVVKKRSNSWITYVVITVNIVLIIWQLIGVQALISKEQQADEKLEEYSNVVNDCVENGGTVVGVYKEGDVYVVQCVGRKGEANVPTCETTGL